MTPDPVSPLTSPPVLKPSWNPLNCTGTDLPINLTVMVKMLAIVLLITGHVRSMPDPWLPILPQLDMIPGPIFKHTLQTFFLISALAIVFNRRIRLFSLILGGTMLLAILSSKAYYGNNKAFCGLMLFFAGCYTPGGPNFLSWQLALTYFGAGLNKALDVDWHTGVFFENWAVNRLHQSWYIAVDSKLPSLWLARFMCWSTIVNELAAVPLVLIPRLYFWGGLANIFFQSCLLLFVGNTFTLFFYGMCGATFALVKWPTSPLIVVYDPDSGFGERARKLLHWWDVDRRFQWTPYQAEVGARYGVSNAAGVKGLYLVTGNKIHAGFRALRLIVLYNPITYFAIAGAIAASGDIPTGGASLYRRLIVLTSMVLLMPPLAWMADTFGGSNRSGSPVSELAKSS
jgi:hypothetical protein